MQSIEIPLREDYNGPYNIPDSSILHDDEIAKFEDKKQKEKMLGEVYNDAKESESGIDEEDDYDEGDSMDYEE